MVPRPSSGGTTSTSFALEPLPVLVPLLEMPCSISSFFCLVQLFKTQVLITL